MQIRRLQSRTLALWLFVRCADNTAVSSARKSGNFFSPWKCEFHPLCSAAFENASIMEEKCDWKRAHNGGKVRLRITCSVSCSTGMQNLKYRSQSKQIYRKICSHLFWKISNCANFPTLFLSYFRMYSARQRVCPRRGKGSVELANQPAARQ